VNASPKTPLRQALLAARAQLSPDERAARSRTIAARVAALDLFAPTQTVAIYAPMGAEVDPLPIALAAEGAGKQVVFPRLNAGERCLGFAACAHVALVPGRHGTREPPASAVPVELGAIDLVIVPGVAFDLHGHRLGRGGGYYDATLAALGPGTRRVGVAFDLQIVAEVPREPHDARLDAVVTEARVILPSSFSASFH
jgi:5-formyltetrahydrofolate cyclo-ligase